MTEYKNKRSTSAALFESLWLPYMQRTNLSEHINECDRFYAGDQWPDNNAENMPRSTTNIIQFGIKTIASKLAGTPLYIDYASSDVNFDCAHLRDLDESVRKMIDHETFTYGACVNGENYGLEIAYVSWDAEHERLGGFFKGGLKETHIHPLNFACSNPHNPDIQAQEWVMVWNNEPVAHIKEIIDEEFSGDEAEFLKEKVTQEAKDAYGITSKDADRDRDLINQNVLRVYLRFFRVDGEVCYTMETETVSLYRFPKPMSTSLSDDFAKFLKGEYDKAEEEGTPSDSKVRDYGIDFEDTIIELNRKANSLEGHRKSRSKFSLYPFAIFAPIPLNSSIFGASRTKQMIPDQKAINWENSMIMKAAEAHAYGRIWVKEDALQGQKLSNRPGQVVIDHSRGNGWGYQNEQPSQMPNDVANHVSTMIASMMKVYNFNDAITGNPIGSDTSGFFLQQAIKESNNPLEQEQKLEWKFEKDLARIRIQFYQHYLDKSYYVYEYTDGEMEEEEEARKSMLFAANQPSYGQQGFGLNVYDPNGSLIPADKLRERFKRPTPRRVRKEFDPETIWGIDFEVIIDVQQGLQDSKIAAQQVWQDLVLNQGMQNVRPDILRFYIMGCPSFTQSLKAELSRLLKQYERSYIQQLTSQMQQMQAENEQLKAQLGMQQQYQANMEKQFSESMKAANKVNKYAMSENDALRSQIVKAQEGATMDSALTSVGEAKSNNSRGIGGSRINYQG